MTDEKMETLSQTLRRTISEGAPLYNEGKKKECFELYLETANLALSQETLAKSVVGELLSQAIEEVTELQEKREYGEGAWVLRHCFDDILSRERSRVIRMNNELSLSNASGESGWQDERVSNANDFEKGQALADVAYILRASITSGKHTRYTRTYEDCFPASEAVELLASLGLGANRKEASKKCSLMLQAGFIVPVSHPDEKAFFDGTHLYRFPDRTELQRSLDNLLKLDRTQVDGSSEHVAMVALQTTLELPDSANGGGEEEETFAGVSTRHLLAQSPSTLNIEQVKGQDLAELAASVEKVVSIANRKYRLKTYEECFVGESAVTKLVDENIASSRAEATAKLGELLKAGLIHHVTRDHDFQDAKLFYRFTSVADLKNSLDALSTLKSSTRGTELVRYTALVNRYKQHSNLDITSILNNFYGCKDEKGWDLVDLENWRLNMKRWGFGKPEDRDDAMIDRLSPVLLSVDPKTWDVTGDERWESPYGILAQIAIFDQISRSAFRGTPKAFQWDELAKQATRVAIEKGYFESAYKSTLNQFLILLPLEHSESWEDQKLGVSLLLQLLSTVAVIDEGLSDYEIVKRLEFSKRLTTAFLEHAQVIAKFKRYPHRNRAQGRTTTLEERIWLASDLVPRWAKSQNPEDGRNLINVPTIPLKQFTKK